jgi:hypothetical protein
MEETETELKANVPCLAYSCTRAYLVALFAGTWPCTCARTCTCACTCTCTRTRTHTCTCTCTRSRTCKCKCTCTCTCLTTHAHTHAYTHTHIRAHTGDLTLPRAAPPCYESPVHCGCFQQSPHLCQHLFKAVNEASHVLLLLEHC